TPPVAVCAYAASGISQGDPFRTGLRAFTLAWPGMYIPFAFVFSPILVFMPYILQKAPGPFPYMEFFFILATVVLGIIALAAAIIGYFGDRLTKVERVILVLALLLLWWHETSSSIIGAVILGGIYLKQRYQKSKKGSPHYVSP
ncbi:MAG: C4-dicarboxylate ABC transporter permease, partial [Thermodesulfobacteriota bacterium]|nr:C4-dicarboxylate ABC transporter permease [Thermodesulfobacteriota bacterium]